MVAIRRRDNMMWAIPGGMVDAGEKATATLKREFMEEALNSNKGISVCFTISDLNLTLLHITHIFVVQLRKSNDFLMKMEQRFIRAMWTIHEIQIMPGLRLPHTIFMMIPVTH